MKLHLPKQLTTLLLAALSLGTFAFANTSTVYVDEAGLVYTETAEGRTEATMYTGTNCGELVFSVTDTPATYVFAMDSGTGNYLGTSATRSFTTNANIIIGKTVVEGETETTTGHFYMNNGYSGSEGSYNKFTFTGNVSGKGNFYVKPSANVRFITFEFTGDMSAYSGNFEMTKEDKLVFTNNTTGTGTITGELLTLEANNATLKNSSISVKNIAVTGTTSFNGTVTTSNVFSVAQGASATLAGASDIAKLSAGAGTVTLGSGVTLTLGSNAHSVQNLVADEGGNTIALQAGSKLKVTGAVTNNIKVTGSGAFGVGMSIDTTKVDLSEWTGDTQILSGSTAGADLNSYTTEWVELNGVYGYLKQVGNTSYTFNKNIRLTDDGNTKALDFNNGNNNHVTIFAGAVEGTGSMTRTNTRGTNQYYKFTGDVASWTGNFTNSIGSTYSGASTSTNVEFCGASDVNVNFSNTGQGPLNVTINDSAQGESKKALAVGGTVQATNLTVDTAKGVTFNNTVNVSSLTLNGGVVNHTASTSTTVGDVVTRNSSLAVSGDITFGATDAQLKVTGSITLDATKIKLTEGFTFDSAEAVTLVTVTDGTLTVNNVGSWTGSTYSIGGKEYTTSLNATDSLLQLVFNTPETGSLLVDSASLAGSVLTLNINANLTDVSSVDLMLSEAALADIKGMSGQVSLSLKATNGTFTTVETDGATLINNVTFYNGAYAGEGAGMYQIAYIPEPASATLGLAALMMLAARRRRKA